VLRAYDSSATPPPYDDAHDEGDESERRRGYHGTQGTFVIGGDVEDLSADLRNLGPQGVRRVGDEFLGVVDLLLACCLTSSFAVRASTV